MSCQDIFDDATLAKFARTVGDSCSALARRLGFECTRGNHSTCLRKWRDTFSGKLVVQKLTWALTKIGMSLDRKLTESLDEEKLDDWLETFALFVEEYWQPLAKKLDFSDDEIQAIVVVFDGHLERQTFHMLMYWKERYIYRNIMGELKLAVWEMRRHDLLKALGEDVLDDDMIAIAAARIGSLWPVVAVCLGFDNDSIQVTANTSSDDKMRATTMLAEWREYSAGEKQQQDTARVLSQVGLGHVAEEIGISSELSLSHPSLADTTRDGFKVLNGIVHDALSDCKFDKPVQVPKTNKKTKESNVSKVVEGVTRKAPVTDCEEGAECMFEPMHAVDGVVEDVLEMVPMLNNAIIVVQEGMACFYGLTETHEEWDKGKRSKIETLQDAAEKVVTAVVKAGCTIFGRLIGGAIGGALGGHLGSIIPVVGTCVGFTVGAVIGVIYGGKLGSYVGKELGPFAGRHLGNLVPMFVSVNDQKVHYIKDLKTGDHVITENAKGINAIISRLDILRKRITLVHTSTKSGVVTEETVDFSPPWRKVIYREADTRLQYLVIEQARNMIGRRLQVGQGSEDFARWCRLKPK